MPHRLAMAVVALVAMLFIGAALRIHPAYAAAASRSGRATTATFLTREAATESQLRAVAAVMSKRLSSLGDRTSSASIENHRIVVHLASGTDASFVLSVLGKTARLYFRPVLCNAPDYAPPTSRTAPSASELPACTPPYHYRSNGYTGGASSYTFPPVDNAYSPYPSVSPTQDDPRKTVILNSNHSLPAPRLVLGPAEVPYDGRETLTTGAMISRAFALDQRMTDQWVVVFDLTKTGATLFDVLARLNYGMPLADDFDAVVVAAPIIEAMSFPSSGEISGNFTKQTATAFAAELNSGPLPVPVSLK